MVKLRLKKLAKPTLKRWRGKGKIDKRKILIFMIILNEQNIPDYMKKFVLDKLDFVKSGHIGEITSVSGGLVSAVFKVGIDDRNIYLKQTILGRLDKLKETLKELPDDIFI